MQTILAALLYAQSMITPQQAQDWIAAYSDKYGIDSSTPTAIASCESSQFDIDIINNIRLGRQGEVGIFQFHPYGIWSETPQAKAGYSKYDVEANIAAGVWAISQGYGPQNWYYCWRRNIG